MIDLIDQQIRAAELRGEFDNLPGAGRPLTGLDGPRDAVLDRIASEQGAKPHAVLLRQQIVAAQAHLNTLADPDARKVAMKQVADLQLRFAIELEGQRRLR